jgi:putative ABC transport system substrate-binding protein
MLGASRVYAGRILKGAKPFDFPVQQVTKALGVTVPLPLIGRADEVME